MAFPELEKVAVQFMRHGAKNKLRSVQIHVDVCRLHDWVDPAGRRSDLGIGAKLEARWTSSCGMDWGAFGAEMIIQCSSVIGGCGLGSAFEEKYYTENGPVLCGTCRSSSPGRNSECVVLYDEPGHEICSAQGAYGNYFARK